MKLQHFTTRMLALCVAVTFTFSLARAANQNTVTPYRDLQTQLELTPGQTYLAFMKNAVKPGLDEFQEVIVNDPAYQAAQYKKLQTNLIEQGAGVAIRIDSHNYIFNIGYLDGSDPENDVKSGRSYGVPVAGTQSDPSDVAYLRELESFLQSEPEATGIFVEALMKVITNCDSSGWSKLSIEGQGVATDFLAIYTAELDRHLMVDLKPNRHPWEIDLAAATFVSVFNTATGLMMQNGSLVEGGLELWWAQGSVGSGIGNTRGDRKALQRLIGSYEAGSPEVRAINHWLGREENSEVIQGTLEYLNSHGAPTDLSGADGQHLVDLMRDYLLNVREHAADIVEH